MCHLSIKLSDIFDQNTPCTFDKMREKPIPMKQHAHSLTLRAKVKVIAKIEIQCPREQKHASQRKFEQGFPQGVDIVIMQNIAGNTSQLYRSLVNAYV